MSERSYGNVSIIKIMPYKSWDLYIDIEIFFIMI